MRALLPLLAGLAACGSAVDTVVVGPSAQIGTVLELTFTTHEAVTTRIVYGPTEGELTLRTPIEAAAGTEHTVDLVGLPPATDATFQVVVVSDDGSEKVAYEDTVTTGYLDAVVPTITATGDNEGVFALTTLLGEATGPALYDPSGNLVWYYPYENDLDVYRARPLRDGSGVVFNAGSVSGEPDENSELVKVSWAGELIETIPIPLLTHDFIELEDGTFTVMAAHYEAYGEEELRGDSLVEIAPDGTQTTVWTTIDCFDPKATLDETQEGWGFANALRYDAVNDAYLLGFRNWSSITSIDRGTATCSWTFGGDVGTFSPAAGAPIFLHQHQFHWTDEGTFLVFDNRGLGFKSSRVVEYAFDPVAGTATSVWSYVPDPSVSTYVLGDVHRFDDGDTLVNWGAAGQMNRVSASGEVLWQVNTELGFAMGFTVPLDGPYTAFE